MNTAQTIQTSPATAAGFDLEDLDNDSVNQITHKVAFTEDLDGNPITGVYIVGKNSAEYARVSESIRVENIKRASKRNKAIDTSTDDGAKLVANTVANNNIAEAVAVTVDWFGFNAGGQPKEFDSKYMHALYSKYPTYLAKVQSALENDANFSKV